MRARLKRRHRRERGFQFAGLAAILTAMAGLLVLLVSILVGGLPAFSTTDLDLELHLTSEHLGVQEDMDRATRSAAIARGDYGAIVRDALRERFPEVSSRREVRALSRLVSAGARGELRALMTEDPSLIDQRITLRVPADDEVDRYLDGQIRRDVPESQRRLSDAQLGWIDALREEGRLHQSFNLRFLRSGDSREPELAGIWGAAVGSFLTLIVTLLIAFPLGVSAAVYLEEFAPRNRWTSLIEVNINNLAAVPSIVFGLLGLAVFLNVFHLPRSAPLVGGMTLALMTLPTIIITSRVSIQAVPPSIREAARGLGASPLQVVLHHALPLALPGILTATIIGMARALGETAPLLMIGMVAFIVDIPGSVTDPSTVLPVQIFLWADSPERAFVEKTSGAIIILLGFLIAMNATAIWLRAKFEKKW